MAPSKRIGILLATALVLGLTLVVPGLLSYSAHAEPGEEDAARLLDWAFLTFRWGPGAVG